MDFIGVEEEKCRHYHSFEPQDWPENVYQTPLTKEEEDKMKEVDLHMKVRELLRPRRYLPCHYFDYICGSSTGA